MALLGEDPLLHLPSLSFLFIVQVALVVGRQLADALPLCCSGGCFAALSLA